MANRHLDLLVPEWQGYAEDNSPFHGAFALRSQLRPIVSFDTVDISEQEDLDLENGILGYSSNLRTLRHVHNLIERTNPETTFLVAGTCASEIAPISFLNAKYRGDITVLWFDAHGDLNTAESSLSKHFHGMPLRILLGDGPREIQALVFSHLARSQVILAGCRDLDPPELTYIAENEIASLPIQALTDPDTLATSIRTAGSSNLYIHLDLDVLEPTDFPHLLIPTPGGVMYNDLLKVLQQLRDEFPIVGSSIVEYVPVGSGDPARVSRLVETLRVQGSP